MEISRRENGRWFHEGPPRRNPRITNGGEPPINYNPWNKRHSPIDPEFQPDLPHAHNRLHRGPHPYQRKHPVHHHQPTSTDPKNIPSLLDIEIQPQPLLAPEDEDRLRASLSRRQHFEQYEDTYEEIYDEVYEDESPPPPPPPPAVEEQLTEEEYIREEAQTKQQIEEIIAVAQALREKLDREEELRRQAEQQQQQQPIPKLMDLKPKIPSLLDIYVPPPVISEEICWNCRRTGHQFAQCNMSRQGKFCFSCGQPGYDIKSCPFC